MHGNEEWDWEAVGRVGVLGILGRMGEMGENQ